MRCPLFEKVLLSQVRKNHPLSCQTVGLFLIPHSKGFVQVVEGEGMPEFERSSHGDLYVEYNVVLPLELSTHTRRSEYIV